MKQQLQQTQDDSTLLQRDHKTSENYCYDKKISYLGKSTGNSTKPGMSPPLCPPSFGKSAVQRFPQLQGSERGQKAAGRMQCQPRKRHKRLGTATPEHFHSFAIAVWIPQLHLCCAKHHRPKAAVLTLHQGATKALVIELTGVYYFPEPHLLPNLALNCFCLYQGLPWSYHGGLLHKITLCLKDLA